MHIIYAIEAMDREAHRICRFSFFAAGVSFAQAISELARPLSAYVLRYQSDEVIDNHVMYLDPQRSTWHAFG